MGSLVHVIPVLTTEIDPNLMKSQCPGGRNWNGPMSSCHEGLIVDYVRLDADAPTQRRSAVVIKKKRG